MPGIRKRKKLPEETVESAVVPLTTRKTPNQVASSAASGRRAASDGDGACDRRPLEQARAPEVLAQVAGVVVQVRPVEVDVPVDDRHAGDDAPARGASPRPRTPAASRSPRCFQTASVSSAGSSRERRTAAAAGGCARRALRRRARRRRARSTASCRPRSRPRAPRRPPPSAARVWSERRKSTRADEQQHHRLEVGEAGEAERAGQELLDVALVVVVAPERDHGERQHDPDGGGQQAERASGDPACRARRASRAASGPRTSTLKRDHPAAWRRRSSGPSPSVSGASSSGQP